MSANLEAFLARLYTDRAARDRFLADRRVEAQRFGLSLEHVDALDHIDVEGLELAAQSFERKRAGKHHHRDGLIRQLIRRLRF